MANKETSVFTTQPPPPSWVEKEAQEITGLDLLGLRVPVNSIGTTLMDGVTTISPMIRYISLRAWITWVYGQHGLPDTNRDFLEFAMRVESAIVLGNLLCDPQTPKLVGSDEAKKIIAEGNSRFDLRPLVKQPAANAYLGPSLQINVAFTRKEGIAGLTKERGLPLALAVDEILKATTLGRKFKKNASLDHATRAELEELGKAFAISEPSDKEREALLSAVLPSTPRDESKMNRVQSYGVLLEMTERFGGLEEYDILDQAIDPNSPMLPEYTHCLDGWACYLVRDMLAVVHEAAFEAVLNALYEVGGTEQSVHGPSLIHDMANNDDAIKAALKALQLLPQGSKPLDAPLAELLRLVDARTVPVRNGRIPRWDGLMEPEVIDLAWESEAGALAALPVAWLLARARALKGEDNEHLRREFLSSQGWARIGLEEVVLPDLEGMLRRKITIRQAIEELALRTIDQHTRIAWARLAVDPLRDVSVLMVDGDRWAVRQNKDFRAGRTAARLAEAIGWLRQLGLTDEQGITKQGRQRLEQIRRLINTQGDEQ
ncbi:MAG TPA: hypothetical protein ENN29_04515 [Candidatus Hydrogenedentes bacterium]|nr:hypothetical protein [Candidatus Hydrogenedentota bacterium]